MAATPLPTYSQAYLEEYNGNRAIACGVVFLVLNTLFVGLRFVARRMKKVPWGWDDVYIVAGTLFSYGLIASCLADVYAGGVGYHNAAVAMRTPWKLVTWAKFTFVIPIMYLPAIAFPKLSICALYLRIFAKPNYRVVVWITAGLVVANAIGSFVPAFVICVPLEYLWNRKLPGGGHCIDANAWYRWASLMNIITDLIMLVLPIPLLMELQTSKKTKLGLLFTFSLGSSGIIVAIIRFVGFFTEDMAHDGTWTATRLIVLTISEAGLYLMTACIVSLKPLLTWVWVRSGLATIVTKNATADASFRPRSDRTYKMRKIPSDQSKTYHSQYNDSVALNSQMG